MTNLKRKPKRMNEMDVDLALRIFGFVTRFKNLCA